MTSEQAVLEALRAIKDPESQKDIVSLGLVRDLTIEGAEVRFTLAYTTQTPQTKASMHSMATRLVGQLRGVGRVQVQMGGASRPAGHAHGQAPGGPAPHPADRATSTFRPFPISQGPGGPAPRPPDVIPDVKHTIAVSSGKGGVGKSTVAVNLAVSLRALGPTGIVDADVYGPDVPLMLGSRGKPGMFDNKIIPVEAHGLKMMSLGLLVNEREPLVWRGPMIHSFIQQMLRDVLWGPLDFLLFDMPPGTGDAQLSLSQVIPLSGVVMVTTPQDVALLDVRKAIGMFQRMNVPVLGIVENMSTFVCPHCHEPTPVFGEAGGRRLAEEYGVPLLAQLPLDPETRVAGDQGSPIAVRRPDSSAGRAFAELARRVVERLDAAAVKPLPTIR
jgi:ATP-binding protein involved in chromosome partitioning